MKLEEVLDSLREHYADIVEDVCASEKDKKVRDRLVKLCCGIAEDCGHEFGYNTAKLYFPGGEGNDEN